MRTDLREAVPAELRPRRRNVPALAWTVAHAYSVLPSAWWGDSVGAARRLLSTAWRDRHALVTVRPVGRPLATPGKACVFAGTQAVSGSLVIGPAVLFLPWWAIAALLAPTVLDL